MNQKSLIFAATLALLVLTGVFWYVQKRPVAMHQLVAGLESSGHTGGTERYENSIIGLAFDYPEGWIINEDSFKGGLGDIVKDGKIYTSFGINIYPKDWDSLVQSNIGISHYPYISPEGKSLDNLPIKDQLSLIDCSTLHKYGGYDLRYECEVRRNRHGANYVWETGSINQKFKGFGARAMVPTGKYIITFQIQNETLENYERDLTDFEKVIDSISLR